jgi:hypothetical protein
MLPDTLLQAREPLRVRGGLPRIVANVTVHNGSSGLEGFVRALHLFAD